MTAFFIRSVYHVKKKLCLPWVKKVKKKRIHLSIIFGVSTITGPSSLQSFLMRSPVSNSQVLMNKLWVEYNQIET